MAELKKPVAKAIAKTSVKPVDAKQTEVKPVVTPVVKAEVKKEEKKEVKKPEVKKAPAKKPAAKKAPAKKTAVKETVHFEFSSKSYTPDELVDIAKDVWKYDLKKKAGDFKSVELYVKPEENTTYYVINGDTTGSFFI